MLRLVSPIGALLVALALAVALMSTGLGNSLVMGEAQAQSSGSCGLAQVAFCDTFDGPAGTGNRSGDLNGTVWGVSRATSHVNTGQGQYYEWHATSQQLCGGGSVYPDQDVRICNGRLVEAVND